jgi:hypothetical protein
MNANGREKALSQVVCLLDELGGKPEIDSRHWQGYHPNVYNNSNVCGDALVAELCEKLQGEDVTKRSLEMQIWWRDHQKADKQRLEREMQQQKTEAEKAVALEKLTPYERKLLGV